MAIKQIIATLPYQDPAGAALAGGLLTLDLSTPATATGSGEVAPLRVDVILNSTGTFSATNLWANDQLMPTGTTYRLRVFNSNNLLVADFGNLSIVGASPIDISLLVPVSGGGGSGFVPGAVLLNPSGPQTVANTFSLTGGAAFNRVLVDNAPSNFIISDFGVHVMSLIDTIRPAPNVPTKYPLGNDGGFGVYGPADVWLATSALEVVSSTSVSPGTTTVTVSSPAVASIAQGGNPTALFSGPGGAGLIIDPGTANQETVSLSNWSIASANTLTILFTKSHTQPYRIRQQGTFFVVGNGMSLVADPSSQLVTWAINDAGGNAVMLLSLNASNVWPNNGVQFPTTVTGAAGSNLDYNYRMNNTASHFFMVNAGNTANLFIMDNSGNITATAAGSTASFTAVTSTGQVKQNGGLNVSSTVISGTSTLTANATLGATTSQAAVTTAASGTATTDSIEWSYATAPGAGDSLCIVQPYVTSGNVQFVRSNPTAANQNVSAIVINWRVVR